MARDKSLAMAPAIRCVVLACLIPSLADQAFAAASWISPGSGLWRDGTNWSGGRAPNPALGSTLITNANTKTVIIDALTPSTNLVINSLTISGSDSTTNTLLLADAGTNNPLSLVSSELKITQNGSLIVTNSSLVLTGSFSAGFNIFAGSATLESGSVRIIEDPGTTNVTLFVRVGRTNAGRLTINGGVMEAGSLLLADAPFAQFGAQGTLRITGGLLSLSGELSVGTGTRGTGLVELLGGQLQVADNQTNIARLGDQGLGQMIVSNATARLGNMSVARHAGARGTLFVQTNGLMRFTDDLSIARFSGSTGAVFVVGGRIEVADHPIWVGREGVGQLVVSNGLVQALGLNVAAVATNTASGTATLLGGRMILSSNLVVGSESTSEAQVLLAGGDITVTNLSTNATVNLIRGSLTMNAGTMTVDRFVATNSGGQLVLNHGTLRARGSVVANGLPVMVGDGTQAATLELLGGTHSFADGLIISSNATLAGCGVIFGQIVNHGTIATNCGAMPAVPTITEQPVSQRVARGGTATFSVTAIGDPPLSYQWRFSGAVGDIPGGTNQTLVLTNVQATDAGDYRVVVSNAAGSRTSDAAALEVLVPPVIVNVLLTGGTNISFSFESLAGPTYVVEYKNTLNDANWTTLRTESGNGGSFNITDSITAGSSRFFRIRVE